jgi:hypothetical protein
MSIKEMKEAGMTPEKARERARKGEFKNFTIEIIKDFGSYEGLKNLWKIERIWGGSFIKKLAYEKYPKNPEEFIFETNIWLGVLDREQEEKKCI